MNGAPDSASSHPATWRFDLPIFHALDRPSWRAWLVAHHRSERGVWLCSWRPATGLAACPYPMAVEEALCFGWIDSTRVNLDQERALQLYTPRKPRSSWTRLNRQRVDDMERRGLMTEAGREVVARSRADGSWTVYDQVEDLVEPPALQVALDAAPAARQAWDGFPPSARKVMLWWVIEAVRPDTKAKRIAEIVAAAAEGRRARG